MVDKNDLDANGKIDLEEFEALIIQLRLAHQADEDKDGFVSRAEKMRALRRQMSHHWRQVTDTQRKESGKHTEFEERILQVIVEKVFEECSSDEDLRYITEEDFSSVLSHDPDFYAKISMLL